LHQAFGIGEDEGRLTKGTLPMKRSRRVVLTMMGSATVGAVSMGLMPQTSCGPGNEAIPAPGNTIWCRPIHGGFGATLHRVHGHGHGHGHAGGAGHGFGGG
jgi:hypothetical protein